MVLLVFVVLATSLAYGEGGKEIGLCEVFNTKPLESQHVSVRGRIGFTMHGMFLLSDECKGTKPSVVVLFPNVDGTPPVRFALDPQINSQLRPFVRPSGGTAVACGVLDGAISYVVEIRACD